MAGAFGYTPVQLVTLLLAAGSAAGGLFIGTLAYRGLRRHDSRQMLYLSVGMILLFGVAYGVSIVGTLLVQFRVLALPAQDPFRLTVRLAQFAGLVCIAYSLYVGGEE